MYDLSQTPSETFLLVVCDLHIKIFRQEIMNEQLLKVLAIQTFIFKITTLKTWDCVHNASPTVQKVRLKYLENSIVDSTYELVNPYLI